MVTVKGYGWEGRDFAILYSVSLTNVFVSCLRLPEAASTTWRRTGCTSHSTSAKVFNSLPFFFNKRKALIMCRYPEIPRIFVQDVLCIFSSNMCNIVSKFFMNKLVLTNNIQLNNRGSKNLVPECIPLESGNTARSKNKTINKGARRRKPQSRNNQETRWIRWTGNQCRAVKRCRWKTGPFYDAVACDAMNPALADTFAPAPPPPPGHEVSSRGVTWQRRAAPPNPVGRPRNPRTERRLDFCRQKCAAKGPSPLPSIRPQCTVRPRLTWFSNVLRRNWS